LINKEQGMSFRLNELVQPLMALFLLMAIVVASFLVIAPFLVATLWAIIVVSATWDQFSWLSAKLGGRDGLAASLIVGLLMLFIMVPLVLASIEFAQQLTSLARELQQQIESGVWPELPQWLQNLPYAGEWLQIQWLAIQQQDMQVLAPLKGVIAPLAKMMLSMAGSFGAGMLMLLISLLISGVLYANGDTIHRWVLAFSHKVAPMEGARLLSVAHTTIRGVVNGFIGAAIAQGAFAWFGYAADAVGAASHWLVVSAWVSRLGDLCGYLDVICRWLYR